MKNYAIILLTFIAFVAFDKKKEQITFETLTHNEKALLFPNKKDTVPYATLSYQFSYPKTFKNTEKLKGLQKVFQELFFGEGYGKYNSPKEAKDAYVKSYVDNYRKEGQEFYIEESKGIPAEEMQHYQYSYTDEIRDSITFYNNSIVSYQISNRIYTGGAHPTFYLSLTSINLNTLDIIKLKDIFIKGYEEELGEIIRAKLLLIVQENGGDKSSFFKFDSIMPNDNFYLTKTAIQFTYNSYEIASYAAGKFDVEITYQELKHILQQEKVQSYFKKPLFETPNCLYPDIIKPLDFSEATIKKEREQCSRIEKELEDKLRSYDELTRAEKKLLEKYSDIYEDIWDIVGQGDTWYSNIEEREVSASSQLKSQGANSYKPQNAHDLSYETAWVEGDSGYGIGEYLLYTFSAINPRITEIIVVNGYVKSKNAYYNNSRVKKLKVYLNDKPYAILCLEDKISEQRFEVKPIGNADRDDMERLANQPDWTLKFEILEVYKGKKYKDTAISEIYFDGIDVF